MKDLPKLSLSPASRSSGFARRPSTKDKLSYARWSPAHHARVSPEARRGAFIACPKGLLGLAESGMTPREARRAGGVGPKPAPVVSAPPRGGPNRLGRSPSAAVVARDRRDTRRAVAPAQNAHGHRRDETPPAARPGGLGDFGLPRGTRRAGRDGVDDERSPLLRWLENHLRGVARGQRVPSHPLYLPVPVATRSYERRVFACASPSSLRPSQLLGSLHNSAYSRSGGPSKTAIPSQRAAKTLHNVDHEARRTFDRFYPGGLCERGLPS